MNGSRMWVIAMTTPKRLKMSWIRSSIRPRNSIASLSTPWVCSTTIHAVVRTSSEVQNGSSTRIISRLLMRSGMFASRKETG